MKNATEICIVLDRSGSMSSVKDTTIESFNTFIREQKIVPGEAHVSLIQFDNEYTPVYLHKKLSNVNYLDDRSYQPRGMTRLYDAIGKTAVDLGERLRRLSESERPDKVLFVIITDGQENDSQEYRWDTIKQMINHQSNKYSWRFLYLGANQDAMAEGTKIGILTANSVTFDHNAKGTGAAFMAACTYTTAFRSGDKVDTMSNYYNQALEEDENTDSGRSTRNPNS